MNCPHCGKPIAAIVNETEQAILLEMGQWRGYVSRKDDLGYCRTLMQEFGFTDQQLLAVCRDMSAWLDDRPREKGGRGRLRNFCKTAVKDRPAPAPPRETVAQAFRWQVGEPVYIGGEYVGTFNGTEIVNEGSR